MSEWKTIDTAPRDAISILVMQNTFVGSEGEYESECLCHNTYVASWWGGTEGIKGEWICYMDMVEDPKCPIDPTHWMPLPPPPSKAAVKRNVVSENESLYTRTSPLRDLVDEDTIFCPVMRDMVIKYWSQSTGYSVPRHMENHLEILLLSWTTLMWSLPEKETTSE